MAAESIIPEIDISALTTDGSSQESQQEALSQIHKACKDVGFMTIVGHGVPQELIDRMYNAGREFFQLPKDVKMSIAPKKWNSSNTNVYRGYFPATVFGKEGLDMTDFTRAKQTDPDCHLTEVLQLPKEVGDRNLETFKEYYTALHSLGTVIVKSIFRIFNANESIVDDMLRRPDAVTTFRLNYYPQNEDGYDAVEVSAQDGVKLACETHTDSVIITILYQDDAGGLQVQSPWDKSWHDVPCNRKAFVVNTTKAMCRLTNGKYIPTFHRVLLGTNARMSIPFFLEAVPEFVLDSKDLLPDEERQFDPITYKEHILYTNSTFKEYQR